MSLFSAPKIVFQPCTISAGIVVGDSRNLVILTNTNQTSNARSAPSNNSRSGIAGVFAIDRRRDRHDDASVAKVKRPARLILSTIQIARLFTSIASPIWRKVFP
jgi:hypothetical protein